MYVSLRGQIGIWLPADEQSGAAGRRMVSYAPGVVFGEMGLLQGQARSADAIARTTPWSSSCHARTTICWPASTQRCSASCC
jgi:CRP-like cAMP-binding protein